MSTSRGRRNPQLWGARQQEVRVPLSQPWAPHESTALYLVTRPLPNNVSTIQFDIISRDQGWGNPDNGLWSWFEVSILGSLTEETITEFHDLLDPANVRRKPEEFGGLIQEHGLYFKDITRGPTDLNPKVSITVVENTIQRHWQHHTLTWRRGGDDETAENFFDLLEEGDRLAIWTRATFPGWVNRVQEARIMIETSANLTEADMSSASGTVTENGEIYQAQGDVQTAFEIPHGLPAAGFSSIPTLEAEQTSASRNDSMKNGTVEDGSESQERPPVSDVTKHLPMLDWALYITPPDDPKRPKIIYVIGSICMIDFARSPSTQSLAKALTYLYLATRIEPENPKYRGQYALALALRYNMTERITDLDLVITELETATATTNKWPGRFWKLKFLAETYKWRHHLTGNSEDLRKYSDIMEDLYNTTPDQFPDRAMISSQRENFKTFGIDDLAIGARFDMAVGITEDAFSRTARGERTYGEILRTLSDQYLHRWGQTGSSEDLNLVISAAELQHSHALEGDMPIGGATAGVVLAFYLRMRWDRHRCHGDLTRALQLMKEASDGALPGSSFQITCIILRASLLSEWPDGADQVQVLRASIEDIESAIAGSIDRISTYWKKDMLGLLSQQYKDLYRCTKDLTDLEKAIELIENYHDLGEEIGQQKEPSLGELGRLLIEKASCTGDNAAYRHGLRCLKQCCLSDLTLPDDRVKSARLLVHKAVHGEGWELACQIAEVIFPVMSLISSRDLSHDDKIHNLRSVSSLTSDACAAFLTLGFSNSALEKIELGQGILIGDMIDLQGKLHDLEQAHPELAQEYDGLRREASRSIESNRSEGRGKQSINNRRATFQRLQQCENRIREKPCFEAFLRPLTAPEMAGISYEGPIIVVNTTCVIAHALILTSSEIGNLRLESMVSHAAPQFRQHLARCAMEPGARDLESDLPSEAEDKELLSWLWYTCVKPVLEMLTSHGDISIGEEKSRVWWMGVGAASGLPFHAAGDYSNGTIDENENCLDRVISSYTPTLKALRNARERVLNNAPLSHDRGP